LNRINNAWIPVSTGMTESDVLLRFCITLVERGSVESRYSALIPADLMTSAHVRVSVLMRAASSAGVLLSISRP
jgi:hypothetical protein